METKKDAEQSAKKLNMKIRGMEIDDLPKVFHLGEDLFDPEIGWPRRRAFTLPLKAGETRLLRLLAIDEATVARSR